ncbi:hypothetical protein FQA39_LY01995 [Lamprigera yunnana]|nr:hypothetical protein FQA39_LY01995 [Lamprigera yunnana]
MASSGKKGKKTKGKTFALNYFLQETPGSTPTIHIRKSNTNWADEVEDIYDQYESGRPKANVVLPTAPKSVHLSNLPYDVQEQEISEFFGDLKIAHMRIPREERPGELPRLKGFGYVEFEDRESLVGALSITDCTLKNRRIRIEVADNSDNDRKRGGRMDKNPDRGERSDITSGDWRSRPRVEPSEPERSRPLLFSRDRDNTVNERNRGGSWRDSSDRSNLNNLRDGDRNLRDGDRNRFNDGAKRGFGSRRGDRDDKDSFSRGNRDEPAEPKRRPKLVLAQRTIPLPTEGEQTQPETVTNPVPASNSIFGKAKPVDTSIKERQIEEWLAKQSESSANDRDNRRDRGR